MNSFRVGDEVVVTEARGFSIISVGSIGKIVEITRSGYVIRIQLDSGRVIAGHTSAIRHLELEVPDFEVLECISPSQTAALVHQP